VRTFRPPKQGEIKDDEPGYFAVLPPELLARLREVSDDTWGTPRWQCETTERSSLGTVIELLAAILARL